MDGNKKASNIRCRNCSLKVSKNLKKNQRSLRDATLFMKDVLQSWIAPTPVLPDDNLCKECFSILLELPVEKSPPAPMLGNRCVCFGCGTSLLQTRARTVDLKSPLRNILIKCIPAHLVPRLTRVCYRCWHHALIEMRRRDSFDNNRQLDDETIMPEDTNKTIPLEPEFLVPVQDKPPRRSSSTESVDSGELKNCVSSTKMSTIKLKQRKNQRLKRVKPKSQQHPPPQKDEFETSLQDRYEKLPAYALMEVRRMIYRVYRYLQTEYKCMKAHTNDTCDLSPLANVVSRTATATGVSHATVKKIVQEREAEALKNSQKSCTVKKRDISPAADLVVAMDHCYNLLPPREPTQYNTLGTLLEPRKKAPCREPTQYNTLGTLLEPRKKAPSRPRVHYPCTRRSRRKSRRNPSKIRPPRCTADMKQNVSGTSVQQEENHQGDPPEPMEDDKSELILKCEVFDEGVQQSHSTVDYTPPDATLDVPVKVEPEEDHSVHRSPQEEDKQFAQKSTWNMLGPPPQVWYMGRCPKVVLPGLLEDFPKEIRVQETPANTSKPLENYPEETRLQVANAPAKNTFEPPDGYPPEETEIQVTKVPANTFDMVYLKYVKQRSETGPLDEGIKPKRRTRQKIRLST